ncbi:MAG: class I SAM-dependent methyltransferase [Stenotrophobium sp.]
MNTTTTLNISASRKLKNFLFTVLKSKGVNAFLMTVAPNAKVIDIGCGNDSPFRYKSQRPDIHYTGLDIGDYNQQITPLEIADQYVVVPPADFAGAIEKFQGQFDGVISSHNLEHCDDPDRVLSAMAQAVKPGGKLYLAFPCEASTGFPKRVGTLNFYDDSTHRTLLNCQKVCTFLESEGYQIDFSISRYKPKALWFSGLLLEPLSVLSGKLMPFGTTWAFYGFESVIWASKKQSKT